MPKPGGKRKRRGKKEGEAEKRQLEFKEDGQEYGRVTKMLGDGRIEAKCSDGEIRICHIRGKMRKRVWINIDDLVLVDIREFQDNKGDVIYKYNQEEDRTLQSYGELTGGTAKEEREDRDNDMFPPNSDDDSDSDKSLGECNHRDCFENSDNEDEQKEQNEKDLDDMIDDL